MRIFILSIQSILLLNFAPQERAQGAPALDHWVYRTAAAHSETIHSVRFYNGQFYGIGNRGILQVSSNGVDWLVETNLPVTMNYQDIALANGRYLASSFQSRLLLSADRTNWSISATSEPFRRLLSNGKIFVRGASEFVPAPAVLWSTNGVQWTRADVPGDSFGVFYANDRFFALTRTASGSALHQSSNGIDWVKLGNISLASFIQDMCYGNGTYLLAGGPTGVFSSTNLVDWSRSTLPAGLSINEASFGNGTFVLACNNGIRFSTNDGRSWALAATPENWGVRSIAFGNGRFVAVAESRNFLMISTNGQSWSTLFPQNGAHLVTAAASANLLLAAGDGKRISGSGDGKVWNVSSNSPIDSYGSKLAFGGGLFVAARQTASGTVFLRSDDGALWRDEVATTNSIQILEYHNRRFLAGGRQGSSLSSIQPGVVCSSPDGRTWTTSVVDPSATVTAITFGNSNYLAGTYDGKIYSSTNALDWKFLRTLSESPWQRLAFAGERYRGLLNGALYSSTNGLAWTRSSAPLATGIDFHTAYEATVMVCDFDPTSFTTPLCYSTNDWASWKVVRIPTATPFKTLLSFHGSFLIFGHSGLILQSGQLFPWLSAATLPGGRLQLSIEAQSGSPWKLLATPDLSGNWIEHGLGDGSAQLEIPQTGSQRFFKIGQP